VKIAIVGQGGIGSFFSFRLSDFLALKQFENIDSVTLFDADVFEAKNRWLQNAGLLDEASFHNKAVGLANFYNAKLQATGVIREDHEFIIGVDRNFGVNDFPNYDVIVSAVDSVVFRRLLYKVAHATTQAAIEQKIENPYVATSSVTTASFVMTLSKSLTERELFGKEIKFPASMPNFWWMDLRCTGKMVCSWVKHEQNSDLDTLLTTLPPDIELKGGCQAPEDEENKTYQNGSPFIADWGVQILAMHLRGEKTPAQFVYAFRY